MPPEAGWTPLTAASLPEAGHVPRFICVYAIHVASQAKDRFGAALAIGIGALIFWHAVFNIGMAIGVLPVVGVTLPLFSYGGSNVVTTLVGLGLLMNVSMRR